MRTYARIQDRRVVELLTTDQDIPSMFHPNLIWIDVSSVTGIAEGWSYDGLAFIPPLVPKIVPPGPSISAMQAQLAALTAQLSALARIS
jgi:hypothetical protein